VLRLLTSGLTTTWLELHLFAQLYHHTFYVCNVHAAGVQPVKHTSCALVHSSWRAAAAEATTEIKLYYDNSSLSAWLLSHCSKVQVVDMTISDSPACHEGLMPLRLPVIHLQHLQELDLRCVPWESATVAGSSEQPLQSSSGEQGALPSLASLTALTRLDLTGASVRLDGLEALTGLKELRLSYREDYLLGRTAAPNFNTADALLAAALPKLQRLTRLCLEGDICSSSILAQVSTLQRLEQLILDTAVICLPTMPQSLTQLYIMCDRDMPLVFTGSSSHGFSQLTGLQELSLWAAASLDATLLGGMIGLREVNLNVGRFAGANTQPLLVFSRLTALESLSLSCKERVQVTSTEVAALTTSSHLTSLLMADKYLGRYEEPLINSLREAHYEAMFPPGRQLQRLRQLRVGTALLSSQVDVGRLTGLTSLALLYRCRLDFTHSDETVQLAAGLKALTVLEDLAKLELNADNIWLPAGVWSSLAALTGIRDLTVKCAASSGQHLLALTSCQRLEKLHIQPGSYCDTFVPGFYRSGWMYLRVGVHCFVENHAESCKLFMPTHAPRQLDVHSVQLCPDD